MRAQAGAPECDASAFKKERKKREEGRDAAGKRAGPNDHARTDARTLRARARSHRQTSTQLIKHKDDQVRLAPSVPRKVVLGFYAGRKERREERAHREEPRMRH